MFIANLTGTIRSVIGRDIHGRHQFGPERPCAFAIVSLKISAIKTTVRADSSASRGSADETVVERGKILIPSFITVVKNDDIFEYQSRKYRIASVHPRYSVNGVFDHWEVDVESFLG